MIRWAVFVSGKGSNLLNLLKLEASGLTKNNPIIAVHADRVCPALQYAKDFSKESFQYGALEEDYYRKLLHFLESSKIDRIFLLGYMRILKPDFLKQWGRPIVNLHPSLLPKYKGLRAIQRAYEAGDQHVGASLHEVVDALDSGPLLKQASLERHEGEALDALTKRLQALERALVRDYFFELESRSLLG